MSRSPEPPAIREETRGPARVVTVTREARKNALDRRTVELLAGAIERASADPAIRGVVLAGEGDVFLAGGDLVELGALLEEPDGGEQVLAMGSRLDAIAACEVPVVAAIGGDVYGGGCEVVLACDDAVAEDHVRLTFRHVRMGLCPAWGGAERLVARVGPARASRLLLGAPAVPADEALAMGLVTAVVPRGGAVDAAVARVEDFARAGRDVVAANRRLLRAAAAPTGMTLRHREADAFRVLWGAPAHREAMSAFARRRPRRP